MAFLTQEQEAVRRLGTVDQASELLQSLGAEQEQLDSLTRLYQLLHSLSLGQDEANEVCERAQ
jgi:hypothetical protein